MNFTDKVIVITGGTQGFGRALAVAFSLEGAKVVISSNHADALKTTAKELGFDHFKADVTSFNDLKALAEHVASKYGRIDIWINNAGVQIAPSNLEDVDIDKLHRLFAVNFFGYFYGCKAVLPVLKKQGSGSIINVNSTAGLDGKPGLSAYVSSKFAIKGLAESIRQEVKGSDIKIYGIFPGGMQTDIYKEQYPDDFDQYMTVDHAIQKVMQNLKGPKPEADLVIRRPK